MGVAADRVPAARDLLVLVVRDAEVHWYEAFLLSATVAAERCDGRLVFYNASGVLYTCPEDDEEQVRLGAAILLTSEMDVQVQRLTEFLEKDPSTLWRIRRRYEREGVGGIPYKYEGRPPHKLTEERLEEAQALLDEGASRRRVAEAVGVTAGAIQYAIGTGKLKPRSGRRRPKGQGPSPRERNEEDRATEGGVAVKPRIRRSTNTAT